MALEYLTLGDCLLEIYNERRYVYGQRCNSLITCNYPSSICGTLLIVEIKKLPNHKD